MRLPLLLTLVLLPTLAPAADQPLWLAVGPGAARKPLAPLMAHREARGLDTRFLALEDLTGDSPFPDRIRTAVLKAKPTFVLLVGDGAGEGWVLPGFETYRSDRWPRRLPYILTDLPYGDFDGDGLPDCAVGRFPARDVKDLEILVAKTLRYERDLAGGVWQKQVAFVCGTGGFGHAIDTLQEGVFALVVRETVPPGYDIDVTYANPASSYFWPADDFARHVRERMERGALMLTYVGHGLEDRVQRVRDGAGAHPILSPKTIEGLSIRNGSPIHVSLACLTGQFAQADREGIGEILVRAEGGPVVFFGATQVSHPYGNAILGYEMGRFMLDPSIPTVGQAILGVKRELVTENPTPLRKLIDGAVWTAVRSMDRSREGDLRQATARVEALKHAAMYVLLGDPALAIRRPHASIELTAPDRVTVGTDLVVVGQVPAGIDTVDLTLELDRAARPRNLPPALPRGHPDRSSRQRERHRISNDRVLARAKGTVTTGQFTVIFPIPADFRSADLTIKAAARTANGFAVGARAVKVRRARGE